MNTWDYSRTVLRQHEVARFINSTKGDKYSALLPLLGLHPLEVAAENLRQLAKTIARVSNLDTLKFHIAQVETKRQATFGDANDDEIVKKIEQLHKTYCTEKPETTDPAARCNDVIAAIDKRIDGYNASQQRFLTLHAASTVQIKGHVASIRSASTRLAGAADPLIAEKLQVLEATKIFVKKLNVEETVDCPACGRSIQVDAFEHHVEDERKRLEELRLAYGTRKVAIGSLCDAVKYIQNYFLKEEVKSWREGFSKGDFAESFAYLDSLDIQALRGSCREDDLRKMEDKIPPLIRCAKDASEHAPPEVKQLNTDKEIVTTGKSVVGAKDKIKDVALAEELIDFVESLERGVREEIGERSESMMQLVSDDVQRMWEVLHPYKTISGIHLYRPKGADKAIDIALNFHGVEQESPRLTLSEGYRNSLGLCIFLAMAKREEVADRPLFLDDVVVSLDREHRGMIAELLSKEFAERQVILLTHDRDWYTELRQQLDAKVWEFKALLPYETPDVGIRWSQKTTTFSDACIHLENSPDAAGNAARQIMDVELAIFAERLGTKLPFLRGEKNDRRMAYDLINRIAADAMRCFQRNPNGNYETYDDAIEKLQNAGRLLVSWGNRSSHTFDLERAEAEKLIVACEQALQCFRCPSCGKFVWFSDATNAKTKLCECGKLRWRYGNV